MTTPLNTERMFAWDGIQFPIPDEWDLARYGYRRRGADLVLEDGVQVRLQIEWQTAADAGAIRRGEERFTELSKRLHATAVETKRATDWAPHWSVCQYLMGDGQRLVAAFWLGPPKGAVAFVRIHAPPEQPEAEVVAQARRLLEGFRWQSEDDPLAWQVFDLDLRIPRRFRLKGTSFLAGRKMLLFECRFRRLFIWQFSVASRLLGKQTAAAFVAEFLGKAKELPGLRVEPLPDGRLLARRKPLQLFGHYEDIGRGCFRHHLACHADHQRDTLVILAFHYRSPADLSWLDGLHGQGLPPLGQPATNRTG